MLPEVTFSYPYIHHRLMRESFKEHGSSVLDLFRQILLQIEYAGGSDNPITLLCTRWNLKLDNWTSTGNTSSGATSIDTLFIEFQLDLIKFGNNKNGGSQQLPRCRNPHAAPRIRGAEPVL